MDNKLHTLMLMKDMAYHRFRRYEPFQEPKNRVSHFIILDFPNKLMEELNIARIFHDKVNYSFFPF